MLPNRRAIPRNPNSTKADRGEAWVAPGLADFTAKTWDELTDAERRAIAAHFLYAESMPPETFGALHLPHHRASDGAVVYRGVAAAAGRLDQASISASDLAAAKAHLRAHYAQFGEEPPDSLRDLGDAVETERRQFARDLRVDQAASDFSPVIRGYPIVFNSLSEDLGGFKEIIRPQAMDRTLDEGVDLRALVDHDTAKVLGRLSARTLKIRKDTTGLHMEVLPPNTSFGRDIVESVRRGDVTGGSFAFRVMPDGAAWQWESSPPVREVTDMRVMELSVVTFPAYSETDVAAALRSLASSRPRPEPSQRVAELRAQMDAKLAGWRR
jgi:HK97 family phage prohead protease